MQGTSGRCSHKTVMICFAVFHIFHWSPGASSIHQIHNMYSTCTYILYIYIFILYIYIYILIYILIYNIYNIIYIYIYMYIYYTYHPHLTIDSSPCLGLCHQHPDGPEELKSLRRGFQVLGEPKGPAADIGGGLAFLQISWRKWGNVWWHLWNLQIHI